MKRHDETMLWQYAARELTADDATLLEHHLDECLECREGLLEVRQARGLLQDATAPRPAVSWAKVDAGISQLVEARLVQKAKASGTSWRWAAGMACAAALLVAMGVSLKLKAQSQEVAAVALAPSGTHVDQASGLSRIGADVELANDGDLLAAGEVLRTSLVGRAVLTLPDDSRMRLSPGTQLALTRAEPDDVALTLERGRVAVHASHRNRRGFVVHTGGLAVRVVGTLFTVEQMAGAVEVAVVEGKVRVEPPEGEPLFLVPGERVRFEQGNWKPIRGAVTPSQVGDFADLSVPPMVQAQGASRPAPGGAVPSNGLLPRLTPQASAARVKPPAGSSQKPLDLPAVVQRAAAKPGPVVPTKRAPIAQAGTLAVFGSQPPNPADEQSGLKTSDPAEWNAQPPPVAQPPEPQPAPEPLKPAFEPVPFPVASEVAEVSPKPAGEPLPKDLEERFLQRAERGLGRGICERYLLGLEEVAGDGSGSERAEKARILRARCFDAKVRPDLSEIEYRKYLVVWPAGRYAVEARQAIAE